MKEITKKGLLWPDHDHKAFVDWMEEISDRIKKLEEKANESERSAIEFKDEDLERVCNKLIVEHHHFEMVGQGIIILPKKVAELFKNTFDCKEVVLVPLSDLFRKEASKIRKRHMPG